MSRSTKHPICKKIENFKGYRDNYKKKNKLILNGQESFVGANRSINKILSLKIIRFGRDKKKGTYEGMRFSAKDLLCKIGGDPKCQLTGRTIDLSDGPSYHLDHIVPKTKGGDNSLDNCQILCREANQAKADMTTAEFLSLCEEVLNYYKQTRANT
jgi:5-methylcytosine-specific restriction endonuclease McrA